jgi:glycosyltransferase involved in cell wall biosynthesis
MPFLGGVETLVRAIAEQLAAEGHEVDVLTLAHTSTLPGKEVINGVTVRRFRKWLPGEVFIVGLALFFYLLVHESDYDVINAHNYHAMPLFWCSLLCANRLVATTHYHGKGHSRLANWIHPIYRPFGSWAVRRAQQVICASKFEESLVTAHFRIKEEKISIVPNGIPLAALRSAQPFDLPGVNLLYVGRLEEYKRVDLAVAAMSNLPDHYRLYIIGKGPQEQVLREQVQENGLTDRVCFLKNVSDEELFRWYRSAQVLVMMSEAESFGMTALEALAAGCRVVCSPFPPFPEQASRFPKDMLVAYDTAPSALAARIMQAVEVPGRASVDLSEYSWNNIARSTLKIFETLLSNKRGV